MIRRGPDIFRAELSPEPIEREGRAANRKIGFCFDADPPALVLAPVREAAQDLRKALVESLKQLNRDEMEEPDVPGLEANELRQLLAKALFPQISKAHTAEVIEVLVRNGLAREITEARYSWTRSRMVGSRYTITTQGKEFLVGATQRVGRI